MAIQEAWPAAVNEITDTALLGNSRERFLRRLKDEFLPAWEDHVHTKLTIASVIAKKKGTMGGRRSLSSVMATYPQSTGIALFENDNLPTPSVGTYFNPTLFSRTLYSRLRWTGAVERATRKGDKVSWATARTEDLRTSRIQFELNFARMLYLGPLQVLATVNTVDTGVDPDVLTLYGRDTRTSATTERHRYGAHYLRQNMAVTHVPTAEGPGGAIAASDDYGTITAVGSEPKILAINTSGAAPTITISQTGSAPGFATAAAAGDYIIPWRSRIDDPGDDDADFDSNFAGINGLMNLAVDSNIKTFVYGLDRTTYPTLNGWVFNNSGVVRPFNEDYITLAVDRIGDDGTGDDPDTIVCHKSVRREYVKEVKGDRRFPEVITKRGFGVLKQTIGDVSLELTTDRDCMPGVMWVLDSDGFGWFSEAELQAADEGERFVSDKDAHEVVMVKAGNLATRKPHNNAMVDDIQYSVTGLTDI
jgi:hypothetical protein